MKTMRRIFLEAAVAAVVLLTLSAGVGFAAEGRIPISEPITITVGGSYIVTNDMSITDSAINSGSAILISADHVSIDLDGHTLTSTVSTADVIANVGIGFGDIIVKNGKISGGRNQIFLQSADDLIAVENITATPNGGMGQGIIVRGSPTVGLEASISVRNCKVVGSTSWGIVIQYVSNGRVENNDVSNSANSGIYLSRASNTLVAENSLSANVEGINMQTCTGNIIRDNTISANTGDGFLVAISNNNIFTGNNVSQNGSGISLASSNQNTISNNHVSQNTLLATGEGITLSNSSRNAVTNNTVTNNDGNGIQLSGSPGSDFNSISWNVLEANGQGGVAGQQCGLRIDTNSDDNNYSYNRSGGTVVGGNPGGAYCNNGLRNNATVPDAHGNVTQ